MALIQQTANQKPRIDLNGPHGNAFFILGTASNLAKQLGLNGKAILAEMQAGDYTHLVKTFDKHLGHVVDLVLPNNWIDK